MSETEAPILSADDLMAVVDYEWHLKEIGSGRARQRGLEIDEWFALVAVCPDAADLFDGKLEQNIAKAESFKDIVDALGSSVLGLSRRTAAYIVATSLGKGDDEAYRAKAEKWPMASLRDGVCNVMDISFTEGGIEGFFGRLIGPLWERMQAAGMTPAGMQRLFEAVEHVMSGMAADKKQPTAAEKPAA